MNALVTAIVTAIATAVATAVATIATIATGTATEPTLPVATTACSSFYTPRDYTMNYGRLHSLGSLWLWP